MLWLLLWYLLAKNILEISSLDLVLLHLMLVSHHLLLVMLLHLEVEIDFRP